MPPVNGETPYRIVRPLGRGGMGTVYEAVDERTGLPIALKRLDLEGHDAPEYRTALFRREYQTLARLEHPVVVEVFEYGVDAAGPFYTMELLRGDDLFSLLPLPFERACAVLRDVASALALLHTRGLVHRDVTSRNIRVVGDRDARLFDFGTLAPMGYAGGVAGTPPFVPPEALLSQPLDARADLFSLGVVLYQTLTGELPYPGGTWDEIRSAWQGEVLDPRVRVPELPEELCRLTMSLIATNRAARPRHAGRVMEQLGVIGGARSSEPPGVSRSYLIAPDLVGREAPMRRVREALDAANRSAGIGLCVTGPAGVGRSRLLEEAALEGKIAGAVVLSAGAAGANDEPYALARSLLASLVRVLPVAVARAAETLHAARRLLLRPAPAARGTREAPREDVFEVAPTFAHGDAGLRAEVMTALRRLIFAVSREHCLVIVVDDLYRVDEPSSAWLATLLHEATSRRLLLISSQNDDERERMTHAHQLVAELSEPLPLAALDRSETASLVRTVFGSVPGVDTAAGSIFRLSQGLPRDAMALCEHVVDSGLVTYRGGSFFMPSEVAAGELPASMAESHARVVRSLSGDALRVGQALTLAVGQSLTLAECGSLVHGVGVGTAPAALEELALRHIVSSDGYRYRVAHRGWTDALRAELDGEVEAELHRKLAEAESAKQDRMVEVYHLLLGGRRSELLSEVADYVSTPNEDLLGLLSQTKLRPTEIDRLLGVAVERAEATRAPRSRLHALQHSWMMLGVLVDPASFERMLPVVSADLRRDCGHDLWKEPERPDQALEASLHALRGAQERHDGTPPSERGRQPAEAVRAMVQLVVAGIAVGAQTSDWPLRRSLPELLRPFVPLSPAVKAIYENARSVVDLGNGDYEHFRARALAVLALLAEPSVAGLPHGEEIRDAVTYGLTSTEARMGIAAAVHRLEALEGHPRLGANALELEAYLHLQRGDWSRAADCRRRAEQLEMEGASGQMFGSRSVRNEAEIYARAGDVSGVGHMLRRLEDLSARFAGWLPAVEAARGEYERLHGRLPAALAAFDRCHELLRPQETEHGAPPEWFWAASAKIELLTQIGRHEDAVAESQRVLDRARRWSDDPARGIRFHGILRATALAESATGAHDVALRRLEPATAYAESLGAAGLFVGLLHEAEAEIARAAGLLEPFARSARLASHHFRLVEDSAFHFRADALENRRGGAPRGAAGAAGADAETVVIGKAERTSSE